MKNAPLNEPITSAELFLLLRLLYTLHNDGNLPETESVTPAVWQKIYNKLEAACLEARKPAFCYAPWLPPFSYEDGCQTILDSKKNLLLDMRGWGFLTGQGEGSKGMQENEAAKAQNKIGERVAELLNRDAITGKP